MNNPAEFVITTGSDTVRHCVGMDRAMAEPQFVFVGRAAAESARTVYARKMAESNQRLDEKFWLDNLTILPANGQMPSLACPYVRVVDGVVVDF